MEESKFLKALNLKDQIHFLENCLDDFLKRENAGIGISCPEINYSGPTDTYMEDRIQLLPEELQKQIEELLQNNLNKLKEEFKNL